MKRKRKTLLPRVTLLAYSRRDLIAFTQAVEALRNIGEEIRIEVGLLKQELAEKRRRRRPPTPEVHHEE